MNNNNPRTILNNLTIEQKKDALLLEKVGNFKIMQNFGNYSKYLNSLKFNSPLWKEINAKSDEDVEQLHTKLIDKLEGK